MISTARDFDFLHGKWRVRHRQLVGRLCGATEWQEANAIDIVRPIFAGLGNIGRFMRFVNDEPYEGMPLRLFDPTAASWRIWWLDTRDQRMEPAVSGGFSAGTGRFVGDDELRGQPIKVRFDWSGLDTARPCWRQSFSPDAGASWELNSEMLFTRDPSIPDDPDFDWLRENLQ